MSASWIFNTVLGAVLLPPLDLILLCGCGLWLRRRWPRLGLALSVTSLIVLILLSTGIGAMLLVRPLENRHPPLSAIDRSQAQAIVVLGAGRLSAAPEYGGNDVPTLTALARLRYGAHLQRATGLPLLVSGGAPDGAAQPEAVLMATVLGEDFGVPVRWLENTSDNTAQNAEFSARILRRAGIRKILLVTDAIHMTRAQSVVAQTGLDVVPAPTLFYSRARPTVEDWVPSARWLELSHYALHEWLGLAWYALRRPLSPATH